MPDAEENAYLLESSNTGSQFVGDPAVWTREYRHKEIDLEYFRADNAYMWQTRHVGTRPRLTYLVYGAYVLEQDELGIRNIAQEDGAFGCVVFDLPSIGTVSRDLLDSINEINYLERHLCLSKRRAFGVLDVGSGYGRMAHRMSEAYPNLSSYICVDSIPESTHVCRHYLAYRSVQVGRTISLHDVDAMSGSWKVDLALGIRSLTEMSYSAIESWILLITAMRVRNLLVIPNEYDWFMSREVDGSRISCKDLLSKCGYRLVDSSPIISDADVREFTGFNEHFMLYALC